MNTLHQLVPPHCLKPHWCLTNFHYLESQSYFNVIVIHCWSLLGHGCFLFPVAGRFNGWLALCFRCCSCVVKSHLGLLSYFPEGGFGVWKANSEWFRAITVIELF